MIKLSVLDQSPVSDGYTPADALRNTIELARLADKLGYERYWIAEHHAIVTLASPAPKFCIARIGAETSGIRIGSGGVLLPHYSPLKVAEYISHAARDVSGPHRSGHRPRARRERSRSVCIAARSRASGSRMTISKSRCWSCWRFSTMSFRLNIPSRASRFRRTCPARRRFGCSVPVRGVPPRPRRWAFRMRSRTSSRRRKLRLRWKIIARISCRRNVLVRPRALVALGVICADTEAEAKRLYTSTQLHIRRIRLQGKRLPVPTPEQAIAELGNLALDNRFCRARGRANVRATSLARRSKCATNSSAWQQVCGVEELMIIAVMHDYEARQRSYRLIAEAMQRSRPRASSSANESLR